MRVPYVFNSVPFPQLSLIPPHADASQLLQTVNLAQAYSDPKTFVDKPTSKTSKQVVSDFQAIFNTTSAANVTEGAIVSFLDNDFKGEGLELEAVALAEFNASPAFLSNVTDPLLKAWAGTVHGYWTQLIRATNQSALCPEGTESGTCESSLIPLNHTFVVPGGRFREQCEYLLCGCARLILSSGDRLLGFVLDCAGAAQVRVVQYRK